MKSVEEVVAKVLDIDTKSVTDSTSPETVPSWDSFNGLILVTELEKNFNVNFSIEDVVSVKNVGDIKKVLISLGIKP